MSQETLLKEKTLLDNLGKISYTLDKAYLQDLDRCYGILPIEKNYKDDKMITYAANIRALRIKRCVTDKEERVIDCFKNILSLFNGKNDSIALVLKRTAKSAEIFYVVKNVGIGRNENSRNNIELLSKAIRGNFPGTEVEIVNPKKINGYDDEYTHTSQTLSLNTAKAISVLTNIPTEKSENFICQGVEKLLNGVVPEDKDGKDNYTVVFLAQSIPLQEIRVILSGFEEIATAIAPFSGYQFQVGKSQTDTKGEMESLSNSVGVSYSVSKTHSVNVGLNQSISFGIPGIIGGNTGTSIGYGYSLGEVDTKMENEIKTAGTNKSISLGTSESSTYTYKSFLVNDLTTKLEATIKRIDESKANGLWRYATYVLAENAKTSIEVANYIRSLSQGNESFIEPSFIQTWLYKNNGEDINSNTQFEEVKKYVNHFCHPVFGNDAYGNLVTPATNVSTNELANIFAFPNTSVQSIPVIETVRFGREPHSLTELKLDTPLGFAYHMHTKEENNQILISKEELTKHTFITGSTGSGKSNTIYKLLSEVCLKKASKTKFLIIEPAKGEYKTVFGGYEDVTVYGTNPYKTEKLLQINPFSFPEDIHVLEHIDRLVEVLNACWPMYAAMPSILKEAIEKSYEVVGWNLRTSKHISVFPNFDTVLEILPEVVNSSAYSADTSSDYKGALVTRVRSLTKGLSGLIFDGDVPSEDLFNQNVIADISRIGSSETKALIMGILVLKLQEFRMSEKRPANSSLRHITVLEEAHNLLRRTSAVQTQESSNLQGKSVEMLANAIAEMRTYGEGFIIADQSPGLMDMSVIRNTNTKIILRLPDESDRQFVGKAAGLNDNQIIELSRLKTGVAAITQSGWLEPVLCMVDKFDMEQPLDMAKTDFDWHDPETIAIKEFLNVAFDVEQTKLSLDTVDKIRKWVAKFSTTEKVRMAIELVLAGGTLDGGQQMLLIGGLFGQKLRDIPERAEAIKTTQNLLIGGFNFEENDEIIRRINELFLEYYPVNIYTETTSAIDNAEVCVL